MKKVVKIILAVVVAVSVVSFGVYKKFFSNDKPVSSPNNTSQVSAGNVNTEGSDTNTEEDGTATAGTETPAGTNTSSDPSNANANASAPASKPEPEVKVTPESVQKDANAKVEDTITSFNIMFKNMVNNTNMNTSYLKDTVQSDTQVYNSITAIITDYRKKGIKIDDLEFTMDKVVQVEDNIYEVATAAKETQTVGGQTKTLTKKIVFDIKVSSGSKIIGCSGLGDN